jgi:Uma2 family endonuclease
MSVLTGPRPHVEEPLDDPCQDNPWRFLGVTWDDYEAMLRIVEGTSLRVTYDDGELEVVSPLRHHERRKTRLGRIVEIIALVLGLPMECLGSTTLKKPAKKKGLEPDECYYVQNEPVVRRRDDLDLDSDPPPDLAIKVDQTSSSIPHEPIYAGLGVPELWRLRRGILAALLLDEDGTYDPSETSRCFPFLDMAEVARFLMRKLPEGETAWAQEIANWVRDEVTPRYQAWRQGIA